MSLSTVRLFEQKGNLKKALDELEKGSQSLEKTLKKADILHFLGENEKALFFCDKIIQSVNKNVDEASLDVIVGSNIIKSEILIVAGEIVQAENIIEKTSYVIAEYDDSKNGEKYWKGRFNYLLGHLEEIKFNLKKSLEYYSTSEKIFKSLETQNELIGSINKIGLIHEKNGDLDQALNFYNKALSLSLPTGNNYEIANCYNYLGVLYAKKSDFGQAQQHFETGLELAEQLGFKKLLAKIFGNLGLVNKIRGNLSQAEKHYKEALNFSTELNDIQSIARTKINIAGVQENQGELDQAIRTYLETIPLLDKIGNKQDKASMLNNIGLCYKRRGEFNEALKNYQLSIELKKELGLENTSAPALHNIAVIYLHKGELNIALENFQKSFTIWEDLGHIENKSESLQYIGLTYLEKSDHRKSIEFLDKCLKLRKKIGNDILISETLYYLIVTEMDQGNETQANKHYKVLKNIQATSDNKLVKTRTRLAQAIMLQNDSRINKKVEAQELFEEVLSEGIIDNELTIFAMLKLCEFLLLELKVSGEKEVLVEIKTLLEKLYDMAQEQESHTLLIEILIIQSQLALVDFNIKETKEFLEHANEIAEDKELTQYKLKISYLQDSVEKDVIKFANIASSIPINDRINQLQIESYLTEVADHKDLNSFDPEMFKTGLKKNLRQHLNFANLLLMDKTLPEEMKKYVHFIELSSKEIQFSISTLLMIEKFEAGTYYQNLEDFNCDEIIQFRINHYEEKLNEKSLVVDFQKTNEITTVKSDQYLFSRIMDHLLDNAIKFSDEKSTIKIKLETDENSRTIIIENECDAIPEHEQSNLFDKYTQYLIHESTRKHGVGLGLAFCDYAIKSLKGEISLVSPIQNKENGVKVTIRIPKEI